MSIIRSLISTISRHNFAGSPNLAGYQLVRREDGRPYYYVGNNSVTFRLRGNGQELRLKCYTCSKPRLSEIYGNQLLRREIFLDNGLSAQWIDVVVERWIEGQTLDVVAKRAAEKFDVNLLSRLSLNFDRLAHSLLSSDIAHGDLKPENIIVDSDLELHLIDWDAMYKPLLKGLPAVELGTACYNHPSREDNYDGWIDHYAATLISVELRALSIDPLLRTKIGKTDGIILSSGLILSDSVPEAESYYRYLSQTLALAGDGVHYRMLRRLKESNYRIDVQLLFEYAAENKFFTLTDPYSPPSIYYDDGLGGFCYGPYLVTPPIFDECFDFREGITTIRLGSTWHWIDQQGKILLTMPECDKALPPRRGKAQFWCGDKCGEVEIATPPDMIEFAIKKNLF